MSNKSRSQSILSISGVGLLSVIFVAYALNAHQAQARSVVLQTDVNTQDYMGGYTEKQSFSKLEPVTTSSILIQNQIQNTDVIEENGKKRFKLGLTVSIAGFTLTDDVLFLNPVFTKIALDAAKDKQNQILTKFFSPAALDVEKIAKNETECQKRIFEAYTTYNPRMTERMNQIALFGKLSESDLKSLLAPVPATFPSVNAEETYYTNRITTIVSKTISNIIQEAVQAYVNLGWVCNDSFKNFAMFANHRYLLFNNDIVLLVSSFFQSLISKSIALTGIFTQIKALPAGSIDKYTQFGKIVKLLIIFEPASVASLSDENGSFDSNTFQYFMEGLSALGTVYQTIKKAEVAPNSIQRLNSLPSQENNYRKHLQITLPPASIVPPNYKVFFTFNGMSSFSRGILEGSNFAPQGSTLALCFDSQTSIVTGANDTVNTVQKNFTVFGVLNGVDQGLGVLYNFGNLGQDCINGVFGLADTLAQYSAFMANPKILQWNFVYNFGMVYNSIKNAANYFFYPEKNKIKTTKQLGIEIGSVVYNLLSA